MRWWLVALLLALFALLVSSTQVFGAPISLCNLCTGYTISKRADGAVIVRCPGQTAPLFVLTACRNPAVTRSGTTATITCR